MSEQNQNNPNNAGGTNESSGFEGVMPAGGGPGMSAPMHMAKKKKFPFESLLVVLALGSTAGSLAWMRKEGLKSGMTFADVNVDYKPPETAKTERYESILNELTSANAPLDVALGEFTKSPFMLAKAQVQVESGAMPTMDPLSEKEREFLMAEQRQKARREELLTKVKGLKLQGIMGGRVPLARIDGITVKTGDLVADELTVENIENRSIALSADGEMFIITMGEEEVATRKAGPAPKSGKKKK